jgi:uncharacterized UBP type Zn finger protein
MLVPMSCAHVASLPEQVTPDADGGCADCIANGKRDWLHLRMCLSCGHMGCCDSSPGKHASAHYASSKHPVMQSAEQGEDWRWCFEDSEMV